MRYSFHGRSVGDFNGNNVSRRVFTAGGCCTVYCCRVDRGFQGVMKRWGFAGGPSDERGATKFHRRPGSIGSSGDAKVWRGKCMPGFMGNRWRVLTGVKVRKIGLAAKQVCGLTQFNDVHGIAVNWRHEVHWAKLVICNSKARLTQF